VSSKKELETTTTPERGFSRRGFLGGVGIGAGALGTGVLQQEATAAPPGVTGPGEVEITLNVNGQAKKLKVEPRVTLLDALRDRLDLTGAKRVCDRGTCGACTVIVDGKAMYGCTMLAIDAQGRKIQTIEGFANGSRPHPIVPAFSNNDALQCGYCTPGFVVAAKAFLDRNPKPTYEQVKAGLGGNLCRCGTYVGIRRAVLEASKELKGGRNA
jgi:xanthine dehydrogenase YagT iron-sulfur-binding subunit